MIRQGFKTLKSLWNPLSDLDLGDTKDTEPDIFLAKLHDDFRKQMRIMMAGDTRSALKGQGLDLKELRSYQPGDDIRKIDWNVFARTGTPHVKEHYDEKQIPVWFIVDATPPMHFGQTQSKLTYAKNLVGLLGLMAIDAGQKLGLVLWQGTPTPKIIPPKSGTTQLQWILKELDAPKTSFSGNPEFPDLQKIFQNAAVIFCLSDFSFLDDIPQAIHKLAKLAPKHQVHTLMITDPVEAELSYPHGWLPLADMNETTVTWINTSDRWWIKEYRQTFKYQQHQIEAMLKPWSRLIPIHTQNPPIATVLAMVKAA